MAGELAGVRAIVVEDEGLIMAFAIKALRLAGAEVIGSAGDGETGLALALRERPELVLTDVKMPGMDGVEMAERIREMYDPCIVFVCAMPEPVLRAMIGEEPCAYVGKPVNHRRLIRAVQQGLDQHCERRKQTAADGV